MEELQSTEALDREILEDARKKAQRILKNAGDTAAASKTAWERKLEKTQAEVRARYAERVKAFRAEILARLPLDQRRARSEKIDALLKEAMRTFLESLSRTDLLRIMKRELGERAAVLGEFASAFAEAAPVNRAAPAVNTGELRYSGLTPAELADLLEQIPPDSLPPPDSPMAGSPADGAAFPALVIDTPHLRLRVSVE
ncbi:MAG: hypothetical protein LBD09_06040, partial [Treponema sp.]|nr:hypothetical protein [Treponema sp.]